MKQMKWIILGFMVAMLVLAGCQSDKVETTSGAELSEPLTVTDYYGDEIVIEKTPEKIISMAPEMTEMIFALGAGDKLIGRSEYCDYPAETADIPTFGTLYEISVESVVAAQPDVVFLSSMANQEVVDTLKNNGLTVLCISFKSDINGTFDYLRLIGEIVGAEAEADALIEEMQSRIGEVQEAIKGMEKPSVYFVVAAGEGGDYTATGDTFMHGILTLAGGDNIAADATGWSYTLEQIIEKDPDYILVPEKHGSQGSMKEQMAEMEGYKDLTAVKEGRVYVVDQNLFARQGPRIAEGIELAAKIMYPDAL